jgi:hypothetical protein
VFDGVFPELGLKCAISSCKDLCQGNTFGADIAGPVPSGFFPHISRVCAADEIASLLTRVLCARPYDTRASAIHQFWRQACAQRHWYYKRFFAAEDAVEPTPWLDWLARFSRKNQTEILRSKLRFDEGNYTDQDLTTNTVGIKREVKIWSTLGSFEYPDPVKPRNIVAIDPLHKAAYGPNLHAYCHYLHNQSDDDVLFECGSTAEDVAIFFSRNERKFGPRYHLEIDLSKNDLCQNPASLEFTFDTFNGLGLCGEPYRILCTQLKRQKYRSRHGVTARLPARLATGAPNTTITNTLTNLAMFLEGCRKAGLKPGEFAVMVRGDDMFSWVPAYAHAIIAQSYRDGGFVPKVKSQHDIEDCRFCSNAFYPLHMAAFDYYPAPTFKAFLKMFITVHKLGKRGRPSHVRGVCLGLAKITAHVPIFNDLISSQLKFTSGLARDRRAVTEAINEAHKKYLKAETAQKESPSALEFVARMYRTPLAVLLRLREFVRTWTEPGVYHSQELLQFVHAVVAVEG